MTQAMSTEVSGGRREESADLLRAMVRSIAKRSLMGMVGGLELVEEEVDSDRLVLGHWMALILTAGASLHFTFKIHFMANDAKMGLASRLRRPMSGISEDMAIDFMREYTNMAAGAFKATLTAAGVGCGISLPMLTRGFDELLSLTESAAGNRFSDQWALKASAGGSPKYYLSMIGGIMDASIHDALSLALAAERKGSDDDGLDFL
jgi:hypothetical protein